jgi:parallel beta-helix repeat protein
MHLKSEIWIVFFLSLLCSAILFSPLFYSSNASTSEIKALNYSSHSFISVENDAELANVVSSGVGTELDPYIIEGLNITTTSSIHAIHIQNITRSVTIRNCWINTDSYTGTHGIFIEKSSNCSIVIENNVCSYNDYGIYAYDLDNCTLDIQNNICFDNTYGIYSFFNIGRDSKIVNNTCYNNDNGISGYLFLYHQVSHNNCTANSVGINLSQALGLSHVDSNIISYNSEVGISIVTASGTIYWDTTISNNLVSHSDVGISIENLDNFDALNNTINYSGSTAYLIDDAQYWGMSNNTINYSDGNGITVIGDASNIFAYSSNYFNINFTEISHCTGSAIVLSHCDWNQIHNNTIKHNGMHGIYVDGESQTNNIYNNLFFKNQGYGVIMNETEDAGNYIYLNAFILNNLGGVQGWDDRHWNIWWNSGSELGNYWSDWSGNSWYDIDEVNNGDLYPLSTYDFDADGLPDGWEGFNGLDPSNPNDFSQDLDEDGLLNYEEFDYGLNASNADTDYDLLPDLWEIQMKLNPVNNSDTYGDSDADFLTNFQEYTYGTNATDPDTDDDGYSDIYEILAETNPNDPLDFPLNITVTETTIVPVYTTIIVPSTEIVQMTTWITQETFVTKQTADFISISLICLAMIGIYWKRRDN